MFDDWREGRRYRREIAGIIRRYKPRLKAADEEDREAILSECDADLLSPMMCLELVEYEVLSRKARRLGIDYKSDGRGFGNEITEDGKLLQTGNAKLRKLIHNERLDRAEKWVKVIVPILAALTGLAGALIGVLSVLNK